MQTKVLITIDTEVRSPDREDAFEHDVLGCSKSNPRGAYWIGESLAKHGFAGVFFLDVYGSGRFRRAPYPELCDRLLDLGHSMELHTHPDQMYDPNRFSMHEYSLPEQIEIVRDGITLIKKWTGRSPLAHRAGRYGANEDTLRAICENDIHLDSSFFYGRANCKLAFANSNAPFRTHGLWEIPVTVAPEPVEKLGFRFPFWTRCLWKRYQKLDVNTMSASQLCRSVGELCGRVPYIVTFLHSFSFTRRESAGFVADEQAIASFQSLLTVLVKKQIPVVTFEQVAADLGPEARERANATKEMQRERLMAVSNARQTATG